jgi:hypothetical protein
MQSDAAPGSEFAAFDPPLARAVVTVLRREGLRAWLGRDRGGGTVHVFVDPDDREAALACLGRRMDDVQELAARQREDAPPARPAPAGRGQVDGDDGGEDARPLVMERFARAGMVLALVLIPLLVVTLASARVPRGIAVAVVVLGVLGVWAARRRTSGS